LQIGEEAELPISAPAVAAPAEPSRVLRTSSSPLAIAVDVPAPVATPTPAPPVPVVAPVAAAPSGPRGPRVYSRAALLAQQVHAIGSTAGVRTSKRVDQLLEEYGVRSKPKVPTQAVCAEHLELRKEVITLIQLQKQVNVESISHKVTILYTLGYWFCSLFAVSIFCGRSGTDNFVIDFVLYITLLPYFLIVYTGNSYRNSLFFSLFFTIGRYKQRRLKWRHYAKTLLLMFLLLQALPRGPIVVLIMSVWQHVPLLLGQILIAS
jgi:hypothetical protein